MTIEPESEPEPEPGIEPDVAHLRDVQYRDSSNLAKRAGLHVAYRTAPQLAFDWLSAMIPWPADGDVLDVGCGAGYLWEHASQVVPDGVRLTLSDLSPGMVDEAVVRATATGRFAQVTGQVADARSLPFAEASFDLAVSTYALYHVLGPADAVREMARVMCDGGLFVLMTNGPDRSTGSRRRRRRHRRPRCRRTAAPVPARSTRARRGPGRCRHRRCSAAPRGGSGPRRRTGRRSSAAPRSPRSNPTAPVRPRTGR